MPAIPATKIASIGAVDGDIKVVDLASISSYLKGDISIASGTGLSAILASV